MSVLQRSELDQSPLSDLHALAAELGVEGYRGLRRADLVDALISASGGDPEADRPAEPAEPDEPQAPDTGAGHSDRPEDAGEPEYAHEPDDGDEDAGEPPEGQPRRQRESAPEEVRGGTLDILPNGSGFMRADPFAHSRDDVYVSPAQIRRCELRAGDEISGPVRSPRRGERYSSLVRVEEVGGAPAEPITERAWFDDLTPVFAARRLPAPAELAAVPFGRGSRVAVSGPSGSGVTRTLRAIVESLRGEEGLEITVLLAGARPEEVTEWRQGDGPPVAGGSFDRAPEEHAQAAQVVAERAKRAVERGADAVLVVDALDALPSGAARRLFATARNTEEAGSLTIVAGTGPDAAAAHGATTRIVLTAGGDLDPSSGTLRADALG